MFGTAYCLTFGVLKKHQVFGLDGFAITVHLCDDSPFAYIRFRDLRRVLLEVVFLLVSWFISQRERSLPILITIVGIEKTFGEACLIAIAVLHA